MNLHVQNAESDPLKRCFASLGAVLAAESAAESPVAAIVESQLDSVLVALDLQVACLRLQTEIGGVPAEILRTAPAGGEEITLATLPLGIAGDIGSLTFGATRAGFPLDSEQLVLEVAAIKAANILLAALRTDEVRKVKAEAAGYKQHMLHQLVDSIAAEVTVSTPEGEVVFVNRTCIERTGRPFNGHSDWATSDLLHPEDLPRVREAWARALQTTGTYEVDVRSLCADGVYRWVHSHGFPIRAADGAVQNWCTLHLDIHDRKMAEESLRASEAMLKSMVDSIAAPLGFFKPTGELEVVNRQVEDYFGIPFDELSNWDNVVHPEDVTGSRAAWNRTLATGEPYHYEARIRRADGEYRWNDHRGYPMRDEQGRIVRWCVLQTDIHDRRRAEEALAESERRLEKIINTIPAMAWTANPDGTCDFFNRHHLHYVDRALKDMQGLGFVSTFHPDDVDRLMGAWQTMLDSGRGGEVEGRIRRRDGEYRWCLFITNPQHDAQGRVVKWFGVNIDIEDRKRADESLRASELNLRGLTETIPQKMFGAAPDGSVNYINNEMRGWFGRSDTAIMEDWVNLVHPDDRESAIKAWTGTVAAGTPYHHQLRFLHRHGEHRWCDVKARALRDENGAIIAWHGVVNDIHDQKLAEDALRASAGNLSQIINSIPGLTWTAQPDGAAEFISKHYLDYVGLSLEGATGLGWIQAVHPEDRDGLLAIWSRGSASARPGEAEARIRRSDGEYRWFLFRYNPFFDDKGRLVKWFGISIDIEDRRRAEERVRESEMNFRRQTETIPQMLWSATAEGAIDYCNERLLEYSALTAEIVMNGGWVNLLHPDDREPTGKIWRHCTATGEPYTVEVRHFHVASQSYRWILTMALPLRDAEGRILKWYGSCVDIHDRKLADQALVASERRLQSIINAIPALVWSAKSDGSADFANQYYRDYVGKPMDEILGSGWAEALHPDDLHSLAADWKAIRESGKAGESQARMRRADGEYRWFLFRMSPVVDEFGNARWFGVNIDIEERKRADDALRASALNLRRQTETIPQMLWSALPDGSFDYCNARFLDYTGSGSKGVMGDGWKHAIHPEDREATARAWAHSVATGEPYSVEVRKFCAAAEDYHWCLTTALPLRDDDGNIIKWHGSSVDIHDRKLAEQALKESERRLDQIVNTIPGMAWSANPDGMCDFFNRYHLDYVGLPVEEMRGTGFVQTFHPDDLPQLLGPWQEMLATGRGGEVEGRIRDRNGQYRRFLFRTNPLFDAHGKLVKWFGVNIDIEDRKRAEDKLRESELNLRQLTETIPQMLWSTDPDGKVEYSNTRLQEFMGITAEEFEGHSWADCLHPDDREPTARLWAHCVATGTPYRTEARFCYGGKGTYRWCLTTGLPLRDEDGRIVKWHGACVDLHDWKTAQDELRETQSELAHVTRVMTMGHLTASIAHELNQPLSGIMTNAGTGLRMLTAEPPNVEGARETARRTIRDAKRASEVISRLRALFAKRATASEIVDLNTAVQEVIALSSNELQRNGVIHRVNLKDNLPYAMGDRIQLQQVILNFILNGAEAMETVGDRPRELVISTDVDDVGHVRVSVKDVGVGVKPELAEKIFSPFYTTKSSGMGIGLSVSRTIVENHQGRLWAEGNDGPGATFSFSLPSTLATGQVGKA
ncbi:PAS domain-containing protein [Dongia sedimenti]|uniref:histidine kinase n=1 Tax=Dongia sedimenti TaxID=3064282 RepID=A0ABU0YTN0_9PROT|nr:PAS domain-containing protein [Rhodospirillaceae bacterium R-7]